MSPSPRSVIATPATAKGGRTRDRIIDAAAELIYARGAAATTLQDVRTAANVSSSQLYHYFDDKQALVRAVVERQGERIVDTYTAAQVTSLPALRTWRKELVDTQRKSSMFGGCPLGSLADELAATDPPGRRLAAEEFRHWHAAIADGLATMQRGGELRSDVDLDDLAMGLLATLQGGLLLSKVSQSSTPLEKALDAMITLVEDASG